MKKDILCDECKKIIGSIEEDSLVIDGEFGNVGIAIYCSDCKKESFEYKNNLDYNDILKFEIIKPYRRKDGTLVKGHYRKKIL